MPILSWKPSVLWCFWNNLNWGFFGSDSFSPQKKTPGQTTVLWFFVFWEPELLAGYLKIKRKLHNTGTDRQKVLVQCLCCLLNSNLGEKGWKFDWKFFFDKKMGGAELQVLSWAQNTASCRINNMKREEEMLGSSIHQQLVKSEHSF